MRKLLPILLLAVLFISCSSDDDNNEDPNKGKETIDEKIIGKWKVEYSKTIKPAQYDQSTGNVVYNNNAVIKEYMGNFGEPNVVPESGMFGTKEVDIEVKDNNTITSSQVLENPQSILYKIENGKIKWQTAKTNPYGIVKYYFEGNILVMELIGGEYSENSPINVGYYTISKYSKITE